MKKKVTIKAWLVPNPEAYEGKTNSDVEKEILATINLTPIIPYVARIETVTVLDH